MKGRIGDKQRLLHLVDAISEIQTYTRNESLEVFLSNSMMRFGCSAAIHVANFRRFSNSEISHS